MIETLSMRRLSTKVYETPKCAARRASRVGAWWRDRRRRTIRIIRAIVVKGRDSASARRERCLDEVVAEAVCTNRGVLPDEPREDHVEARVGARRQPDRRHHPAVEVNSSHPDATRDVA